MLIWRKLVVVVRRRSKILYTINTVVFIGIKQVIVKNIFNFKYNIIILLSPISKN